MQSKVLNMLSRILLIGALVLANSVVQAADVHAIITTLPSEQRVLEECAALNQGLSERIGKDFGDLDWQLRQEIGILAHDTTEVEQSQRFRFSQCFWLRKVANRCLEPTQAGGRIISPVSQLIERIDVARLTQETEDDCLREQIKARAQAVHALLGRTSIADVVPPPSMFGTFEGPPHDECRQGESGAWARDPHFDNWLDCSQWSDELRVTPSLDDSVSGIDVQLNGQYAEQGYAFSGYGMYSGKNSVLTRSQDDADCTVAMVFAVNRVELHPDARCFGGSSGPPQTAVPIAAPLLHAEAASPPPTDNYDLANKEFDSAGRRVHVFILAPAEVSVAWTLGLNRSMQVSSSCVDLPSYDAIVDFFARYRQAIISRDADTLANLSSFPLQIDTTGKESIGNPTRLKGAIRTVFPDVLTNVVKDLDPHFVYCAHGHVMVAAGRIWAKPDKYGELKVYFVDSHANPRKTPKAIEPN
jgi:hypothetical protein